LTEGELKKYAVTMNNIHNNLPKIIRTPEKIDETIQAQTDAIYKTLYVPLSKIDSAKKDFEHFCVFHCPHYPHTCFEDCPKKKWFGES